MKKTKTITIKCLIVFTILMTGAILSCNTENLSECQSRIDCGLNESCNKNECVYNKEDCETFGVFDTVAEIEPKNADRVDKIYVSFDTNGAARYCYHGYKNNKEVAYYGKQISTKEYKEKRILYKEKYSVCDGLAISNDETAFIISKDMGTLLEENGEKWTSYELPGLDTNEARTALRSDDTILQLKTFNENTVYIAISLGNNITSQPLYVAEKSGETITEKINGWNHGNQPEVIGYAPEIVDRNSEPFILVGQIIQENIFLTTLSLDLVASTKGSYPTTSKNKKGNTFVLYMNGNYELETNEIKENEFIKYAKHGKLTPNYNRRGHIPWIMRIGENKTVHILYEDIDQGKNTLIYQALPGNRKTKSEEIVTTNLIDNIVGNDIYDMYLDICGKPIIAFIENQKTEIDTEQKIKLIIKEMK